MLGLLAVLSVFVLGAMAGYVLARNWSFTAWLDQQVERAEARVERLHR